jgi:hypothetical protein
MLVVVDKPLQNVVERHRLKQLQGIINSYHNVCYQKIFGKHSRKNPESVPVLHLCIFLLLPALLPKLVKAFLVNLDIIFWCYAWQVL